MLAVIHVEPAFALPSDRPVPASPKGPSSSQVQDIYPICEMTSVQPIGNMDKSMWEGAVPKEPVMLGILWGQLLQVIRGLARGSGGGGQGMAGRLGSVLQLAQHGIWGKLLSLSGL